ncbi:carboxylesterase [Alcanivorax sp. NBRC 101098]|nr:carboxylesterase [Alcanivorax sp. NBRC 101098]
MMVIGGSLQAKYDGLVRGRLRLRDRAWECAIRHGVTLAVPFKKEADRGLASLPPRRLLCRYQTRCIISAWV